jgi:putative transposase
VRIGTSRVGVATDNARIELFFGGLKRECINLETFESPAEMLANAPVFLEGVYNAKRLHSSVGTCRRRSSRRNSSGKQRVHFSGGKWSYTQRVQRNEQVSPLKPF